MAFIPCGLLIKRNKMYSIVRRSTHKLRIKLISLNLHLLKRDADFVGQKIISGKDQLDVENNELLTFGCSCANFANLSSRCSLRNIYISHYVDASFCI